MGTLALGLASCAGKRPAEELPPPTPEQRLAEQRELAGQEGKDQVLEQVRLASMARAMGKTEMADKALTSAVIQMQDFQAEGQFRAVVGVESAKEWKGEPYEKMLAFLYLAQVRYERGDYSNALAMTKSAILADTGTSQEKYRADFLPAYVMQALCYQALGEHKNAERSLEQAIDRMWARELTEELTVLLEDIDRPKADDPDGVAAAKVLLLAGLPAGLGAHPREPAEAIRGARSWATDARMAALDSPRKTWPDGLRGLSKRDLNRAFDHLEILTTRWVKRLEASDLHLEERLARDTAALEDLLRPGGLVLWLETGRGPYKIADGRYREILRILPGDGGHRPDVRLDGQPLDPLELDSMTWQAQTRGGRPVDGFLRGKAVFKDSAGILGIALLHAGDIAQYAGEDDTVAAILYAAGALVYVGGVLVNPRADTRDWQLIPDELWIVRADPEPGSHDLVVDGRTYTVQIPEHGRVVHAVPALAPGGAKTFGTPPDGGHP